MAYRIFGSGFSFLIAAIVMVSCSGNGNKAETKKVLPASQPSYVEVAITGMTCTGCEQTITKRVTDIEGVKSVKASFTSGTALIEYYPEMTDTTEIKNAIIGSGYVVKKFTPSSSAVN